MNSIKEFKQALEDMNELKLGIKNKVNDLTNNIYTSIIQMNYSMKVILDLYPYITKFTQGEENIDKKIKEGIITEQSGETTTYSMYSLVSFNQNFITTITNLENFARLMSNALNHYIEKTTDFPDLLRAETIYKEYIHFHNYTNEWSTFEFIAEALVKSTKDIFQITETSNGKLYSELSQYRNLINNLIHIFDLEYDIQEAPVDNSGMTDLELAEYWDSEIGRMTKSLNSIITFRNGSDIYLNFIRNINQIIDESYEMFNKIGIHLGKLTESASNYDPIFKDASQHVETTVLILDQAKKLVTSVEVSHQSINSLDDLLNNDTFNSLLTTIENIYHGEIYNMEKLLTLSVKDYKLIRSIETFLYKEPTLSNPTLFSIMNEFDAELDEMVKDKELDGGFVPISFYDTIGAGSYDTLGEDSFTYRLFRLDALTEPFYDLFNYYRMFLYKIGGNKKYIFDMLETFYIYGIELTSDVFAGFMEKFFGLRIDFADFITINESKLNESLAAKYEGLKRLNYYPIDSYMKLIDKIIIERPKDENGNNIAIPEGKILVDDIDKLTTEISKVLNFNFLEFEFTEKILYDNMNLGLINEQLSLRTTYRDSLMRIILAIIINKIIKVTKMSFPEGAPIGNKPLQNLIDNQIFDWKDDILHIQSLLYVKKIYEGLEKNNIFNKVMIEDFNKETSELWVKDEKKLERLNDLFNKFLREV